MSQGDSLSHSHSISSNSTNSNHPQTEAVSALAADQYVDNILLAGTPQVTNRAHIRPRERIFIPGQIPEVERASDRFEIE